MGYEQSDLSYVPAINWGVHYESAGSQEQVRQVRQLLDQSYRKNESSQLIFNLL